MARPRFCRRCKCADKGDRKWVKPFLWERDKFLRETLISIEKYGKIEKVDLCEKCIQEVKNRGHKVYGKGKEL